MKKIFGKNFFSVVLSVFVSFVFVFAATQAATTISTNINTGGTLTVTGASTLTGALTVDTDTLYVDVTNDRVGIGTSSPAAFFSVGEGAGTVTGDAYFTGGLTIGGAAGINSIDGSILLAGKTSDPTGVTQGTFYYNSTNKVLKMYDGSSWFTMGTSTSGLTLNDPRLQLTDLNYYMTFGTTTQSGLSMMTLEATSTAAIPLTIRGYNAQTANLLQIHSVDGTEYFAVDANGNASSTNVSMSGSLWVGGFATTTASNGNIATKGTLDVTGLTTLVSASTTYLSTSGDLMVNGYATTTASNGNIATKGSLTIAGTASTSAIKVGDEPAAPTINGMVLGYCSFSDVTLAASSTTGFADCTSSVTGALVAGDRVFVQATSSFESQYVITAASTTDVSTIQLRILNTGLGEADGTLSGTSVNFWAIR